MNVFVLWLLTVTDIVLYPEAAGGESASQGADVCLCLDTVLKKKMTDIVLCPEAAGGGEGGGRGAAAAPARGAAA